MDNNNIDNFFRQHSHTMDEAPGEALWQRIEQQLPPVSTGSSLLKRSFSGSKFLLVLMLTATTIVAGIVFMHSKSKVVLQPAVMLSTDTVTTKTVIEKDTVKKKKPVKNVTENTQVIPFRTTKKPINNPQEVTDLSDNGSEQNTLKTEHLPESKVIKTTLVQNPKRTIVTINEVVSQYIFDSITAANIEKYKNNPGMQLIVKEPGSGHIFRTTFEKNSTPGTLNFCPKPNSNQVDVIKFNIPKNKNNSSANNVNLDSLKIPKKTLKVESIKLKLDSIAH